MHTQQQMFHRVWQQQQQEDEEEVREKERKREIVYRDTIFENPYQSQLPQFSVLPADVALPSPSPVTNREKPLRENKKKENK